MCHLSGKRTILLLLLYFVGYTFILPVILTTLTLLMNPNATMISIPLAIAFYVAFMILSIWVAKPIWKDSLQQFSKDIFKNIVIIILGVFAILIVNLVLGIIISLITNSSESLNQQAIAENAMIAPMFTLFASIVFAPIVEETVFRGGVFTFLRKKHSLFFAMLISSLLFGFIHVSDSLLTGQYQDLIYLLVYSGLGLVLSYSYEKSNSIVVSMGIHLGNNLIAFLVMMSTM